MARIDTHFEAFLAERRQHGLGPAGEAFFRDAWTAFRRLPGSYRPNRETVRLLRLQGAGQDLGWRRSRAIHSILAFLQARKAVAPFPLPVRPLPRRVEGRPAMTEPEVRALLLAIPDLGVRTLAALVYFSGVQAGRLIPLEAGQVSLEHRTLHVPDSWGGTCTLPLGRDAAEVVRLWHLHRRRRAPYLLHDEDGRPLTPQSTSAALRAAGRAVGRPAVGFGHLQYAHTRLLAASFPQFDQNLLEIRMGQPFRLRYLRIPNLFDTRPLQPSNHLDHLLKGEQL